MYVAEPQIITKDISSLIEIPKFEYDTIIWDLRHQLRPTIIGGKSYCNHSELDRYNRCQCGAYKGLIRKMPQVELTEKILTELSVSPARDITIIISPRPIHDNQSLHNPLLKTPNYQEIIWLSKYGNFFDTTRQRVTALIYSSKHNNYLSQSKYIVNPKAFDYRLLNLGRTLLINVPDIWVRQSDNLVYIRELDYKEDNNQCS